MPHNNLSCRKILLWSLTACLMQAALADEPKLANTELLKKSIPNANIIADEATDITHLHKVNIDGDIVYLSEDGKYLIYGSVIDLSTQTDLTAHAKNIQRAEVLKSVPENEMIIFSPNIPAKHVITIFTDPECSWCRKLHSELAGFLNAGFKIRYLGYPRGGLEENSATTLGAVYCAKDRQKALSEAFSDVPQIPGTCELATKVKLHYELGSRLGVTGTPSIILEDGRLIPGYASVEQILKVLP